MNEEYSDGIAPKQPEIPTELKPLVKAVQEATEQRPHLSSVRRWCRKRNQYGLKLKSWVVGGRRLTTVSAVREFIDATTLAANGEQLPVATNTQQATAHERAMKSLESEGL